MFLLQLNSLQTAFFLDTGNVFHTPHYFRFSRQLDNPDLYKEQFVRVCMDTVRVIGISGASAKRPKAPAFVQLTPLAPRWESLRSIVHNILHLGVIGYPFVNPGPIGGEVTAVHNGDGGGNATAEPPPLELFVRWWQLATFLPQLHFTYPPSTYRDLNIAPVARKLKSLKVLCRIRKDFFRIWIRFFRQYLLRVWNWIRSGSNLTF